MTPTAIVGLRAAAFSVKNLLCLPVFTLGKRSCVEGILRRDDFKEGDNYMLSAGLVNAESLDLFNDKLVAFLK